jgi:formylglycine-generating enzyme required for sulfatase activity
MKAIASGSVLALVGLALLAGCGKKPRPEEDAPATVAAKPAPEPAKEFVNSVGMKLVRIPAGTFVMGSPPTEPGHDASEFNTEVQHEVKIGRPFYLGVYEVTTADYEKVMGVNPLSASSSSGAAQDVSRLPAPASPRQAAEFCKKLSDLPAERQAGRTYRLPTEPEWEYACRAGSKAAFSFGDDPKRLDEYGWYAGHTKTKSRMMQPVGQLRPNAWGLYDMHGNVSEYCSARYKPDRKPDDEGNGEAEVSRGGDFISAAKDCRCARRSLVLDLSQGGLNTGFRVACVVAERR